MSTMPAAPAIVDIVVLVVTFNSADVLPGLIDSLPEAMEGLTWAPVIVDNDSHDGSIALAKGVPGATVVPSPTNLGYAGAINLGLAAAPAYRAALVLNPDVRLTPGVGRVLIGALDDPGVGIVAPLLRDARGELILSIRREPTLARLAGDVFVGAVRAGRHPRWGEVDSIAEHYRTPRIIDWAEGSTLLLSAECVRRVGLWDESFFLYSEETDFQLRAGDGGLSTLFLPSAQATHLEGGSATSSRLWPLLVVNRLRLYRKRRGGLAAVAFWALLVVREGSRAALGRPPSRRALVALLSPSTLRAVPGPHTVGSG